MQLEKILNLKKNLLKAPILGNHSLFNDVTRRLELKKLVLGVSYTNMVESGEIVLSCGHRIGLGGEFDLRSWV
jgi:hypothetical protein